MLPRRGSDGRPTCGMQSSRPLRSARSPASLSGYRGCPAICVSPTMPVTRWPARCSLSGIHRSPDRQAVAARRERRSSDPAAPEAPRVTPAHQGSRRRRSRRAPAHQARPGLRASRAPTPRCPAQLGRRERIPPSPAPPDPRVSAARRVTLGMRARLVRRARTATACRPRRGTRTRWCVRRTLR